jgi:hypothetical protein
MIFIFSRVLSFFYVLFKIIITFSPSINIFFYLLDRLCRLAVKKINCHFYKKQDSKELSPRSLDKMLLKLQVNSQNVQSTQLSKFFKFSKSSKFLKCSNSYDSQAMSKHVETCLILFRFNMTQIVTIYMILKHV